ncbi:hypothetical protein AVEN_108100-1 [Araneus ventricosus]|uniref:Uncharacterized protein n=1 Tax=Araneus ventricosus TaxID=182803 RepID=A0A4Y2H223_ARAVE|nr:hypothetical protein AVEN_108100-1 [Araneus ventricosus]
MAYLARSRKEDLLVLAEELGLTVKKEFKVKQLHKLITESPIYDEEFTRELLGSIKEEEEKEERETEARERERAKEEQEREREKKSGKENVRKKSENENLKENVKRKRGKNMKKSESELLN